MDVSFTNVLEGARQYFQGLPSASATAGPYYHQQQQPQQQPPPQQQQQQQQQPQPQHDQSLNQHQQPYYQANNEHYATSSTPSSSANQWMQQQQQQQAQQTQQGSSDTSRPPAREITPIQRLPSHSSQYQEPPRQYQQPPNQDNGANFQFSRPQSRDVPPQTYHHVQQQRPFSTEQQQQQQRPSPREPQQQQVVSNSYHPQQQQQQHYAYQSRSYYAPAQYHHHQPPQQQQQQQQQPVATKVAMNQQPPTPTHQHQYYKPQPSSVANYQQPNREPNNTHLNGGQQYQAIGGNEQAYRTTHNLPPIAGLSNYHRPTKSSPKEPPKVSYSSTIQYSKSRLDQQQQQQQQQQYSQAATPAATYNAYSQGEQAHVSSVITQNYTNVIVTTANASPYVGNTSSPMSYPSAKFEMETASKSQPNNYPKPIEDSGSNNGRTNSVIKQRKESPLDLSVKTVRTTADSTESKSRPQSVISSHNYPTVDIEKSFSSAQRTQLATASVPKVEFRPNFNLAARPSAWSAAAERPYPESAVPRGNTTTAAGYYHPHPPAPPPSHQHHHKSDTFKGRYPQSALPNVTQCLQNTNSSSPPNLQTTVKRPSPVEPPAVPPKMPKVENWREYYDMQIEEKFTSHVKQQQQQMQQRVPKPSAENYASTVINGNGAFSQQNHQYQSAVEQPNYHQTQKYNQRYPAAIATTTTTTTTTNHHQQYPSYYNVAPTVVNKAAAAPPLQTSLYVNPVAVVAARHHNAAQGKPGAVAAGADKRVLSLLRNSIEIKEQKKIEQQKSSSSSSSQEAGVVSVQHPNTDGVTAPLQPKPGIDRNNVSPFTPISVPDPNICKMPPFKNVLSDTDVIGGGKAQDHDATVIVTGGAGTTATTTTATDYDGLAAFLAARIRTKGELKEVTHHQNAVRDARLQAFLEDTIRSPHRQQQQQHATVSSSSSSSSSPPKLLKERQTVYPPRKRLFSRTEEDVGVVVRPEMPPTTGRDKSGLRSSSETSVFDFPDSEDENEMPVLERQTLDAMRKDRRNSLKQSTPSHSTETDVKIEMLDAFSVSRPPTPEDDIFASICEKLVDQLKSRPTKRVKRSQLPADVKLEPPDPEPPVKAPEEKVPDTPAPPVPVKQEANLSDGETKLSDNVEKEPAAAVPVVDPVATVKVETADESKEVTPAALESERGADKPEPAHNPPDQETGTGEKSDETAIPVVLRPAKKPNFGDGSDFYPGWEEGVYKYKRSIRMPPSLIQLTRPPMRLSTSLPDLDPCPQSPTSSITTDPDATNHSSLSDKKLSFKKFKSEPVDSDSESVSGFNIFAKRTNYDSEGSSSIRSLPNTKKENKSILDRLLEKCGGKKRKHKRKDDHSPKVIPKADNLVELLPTPTPSLAVTANSPEKSKGLNSPVINATSAVLPFRKDTVAHFKDAFISSSGNSILGVHDKFTTIVMSSRTRKETRALKQRATIKEVFGDDRPASAPPVTCVDDDKNMHVLEPFSKNLEELLRKREKAEEESRKRQQEQQQQQQQQRQQQQRRRERHLKVATQVKKEEDDEENKKLIELVAKKDADACSETMSLDGEEAGGLNRPRSRHRYGKVRRKFSSGFDYIRKKKKVKKEDATEVGGGGGGEKKRKKAPPSKTPESIDDIQKDIKNWVLMKGIGETHLHRAARLGYVDVTAYCLEKMNCPPSPKDNAGYTPLHEACEKGHLEIAKLLLKYGANVHESAAGGVRPLHQAIENGFVEIGRLLLSYGADPYLATYAGQTPLALARDESTKTFLKEHLNDRAGEGGSPWPFYGPASCFDPTDTGYDALEDAPDGDPDQEPDDIEFDMSEALLPNLYTLRDEPPTDRWVLLQDLSHFLKIKSRDALLRQIAPSAAAAAATTTSGVATPPCVPSSLKMNQRNGVIRELKMSDFLEQAHCCQFLNMGEKINSRASKIALVKYTDRVKQLLAVETVVVAAR